MEKIKNQVSAIVVFKCATFQELNQKYCDLEVRIKEGIEKMKASGAFTNHEIEEIKEYALSVRNTAYNAALADVRESIRNNFEF